MHGPRPLTRLASLPSKLPACRFSFSHSLRERLKLSYGSLQTAGRYLQELMGEQVTLDRLCGVLRFLRIGFSEEEARELFAELGKGNVSMSTTYSSSLFKDFLEVSSPTPDQTDSVPTPKAPRFQRVSSSVLTKDQGLNATSAEFTGTPRHSPREDPVTVFFVRDTLESFFSSGKDKVNTEEITEKLANLPKSVNIHDVKYLITQAEGDTGVITRSSFASFLSHYQAGTASPALSALLSRLRSLYGSFLTAYEELTQSRTLCLTPSRLCKVAVMLGVVCSEEDFAAVPCPVSMYDFKTVWLNDMRGTYDRYCTIETCLQVATKAEYLCAAHKKTTEVYGRKVWSLVKTDLLPKQRVELMTSLQLHRRRQSLSQQRLRTLLAQYAPNTHISGKEMAVLGDFLRLRLRKLQKEGTSSTVGIGKDLETHKRANCPFFTKAARAPSAASFAPSRPVSRSRGDKEAGPRCFGFPYPGRRA